MSEPGEKNAAIEVLKRRIIDNPGLILGDRDVMRALVEADGLPDNRNVVDLRGRLVERLEERLDRLEETHRSVIAAAYENLAGTNQVHRAALAILEPTDFEGFLKVLAHDVSNILSIDVIKLAIETAHAEAGSFLGPKGELHEIVVALPRHGVRGYIGGGGTPARVTLRECGPAAEGLYGADRDWVRSEAVLKLDLGPGRLPALLAFGAEDSQRFHPEQGVDLLKFFGGVFERVLKRWLG